MNSLKTVPLSEEIKRTLLATLFLLFVSTSLAASFELPDTGQETCYDGNGNAIPCPVPGNPLAQDGSYSINQLSYTDNNNGTVTDNNTHLIWQKEDDGLWYNWYQAAGVYDAAYNPTSKNVCGELRTGGYDWRLPTKKELISIIDYNSPLPQGAQAIHPVFTNPGPDYWSYTTFATNPGSAWIVSFYDSDAGLYCRGAVNCYVNKTGYSKVRCVRGGKIPAQSFIVNNDGTITDETTGLMWQQGEGGAMTWEAGLSYCENLSLANKTDWRLPNIKELASITDDTSLTAFFPNAQADYYWSSTTEIKFGTSEAKSVWFYSGAIFELPKNNGFYVRCVRGGVWPDEPFQWPLDPVDTLTLSGIPGNEFSTYNKDQSNFYHTGIDMKSGIYDPEKEEQVGNWDEYVTPVWAAADGTVVGVFKTNDTYDISKNTRYKCGGIVVDNSITYTPGASSNRGLGNVVIIKHDNETYSLYGHLDCIDSGINMGGSVFRGTTRIGKMGHSANVRRQNTFGPHLHFEIKRIISSNPSYDQLLGDPVGGRYWGYTPDLPGGYGYYNPKELINPFLPAVISPTSVRVVDGPLDVRTGPGETYATGTKVKVGRKFVAYQKVDKGSELWYRIYLPNAGGMTSGWIAGTHPDCVNNTCTTEEQSAKQVEVTGQARIRINPGTSSQQIQIKDKLYELYNYNDVYVWAGQHYITDGSPEKGSGCIKSWYKIFLPNPDNPYNPTPANSEGWVCGDYIFSPLSAPTGLRITSVNEGIQLDWNANPEPGLAGYKVHYGTVSGTYTSMIDVGNVTTYTITNPSPTKPYFIVVTAYDVSGYESEFSSQVSTPIQVLSPDGGEVMPPGSMYTVLWEAVPEAVSFVLTYSIDSGMTWKPVTTTLVAGTSFEWQVPESLTNQENDWDVPKTSKNKKKCLVKVVGFDANGKKVGGDKSDAPFTIEVVKMTSPSGEEIIKSGSTYPVNWIMNDTLRTANKVIISYNDGIKWNKICSLKDSLFLNPGTHTYLWSTPVFKKPKNKCKVKVVVQDANGDPMGSDINDGYFAIQP